MRVREDLIDAAVGVMKATIRIAPPHGGQTRGSTSQFCRRNSHQRRRASEGARGRAGTIGTAVLMAKDSKNGSSGEAPGAEDATGLETIVRQRARGLTDAIVEQELGAVLGARRLRREWASSGTGIVMEHGRAR
ncbi:MAG: hypothetical protein ABI647_12115 [Gemmatimonadota bacterium]